MHLPHPSRRVYMDEFDTDYWWVIQKVCDILFTPNKYNAYCVDTARSMLNFLCKTRFLTGKQIILIHNLKPINNGNL